MRIMYHRHRVFTSILAIALVALFSPVRAQAVVTNWTILVYLNAKNNLEPFAVPNLQQMNKVQSSSNVNIVVELGMFSWEHVYRMRISPSMDFSKEPKADQNGAIDLGEVDMGSVDSLKAFLKWGKATSFQHIGILSLEFHVDKLSRPLL